MKNTHSLLDTQKGIIIPVTEILNYSYLEQVEFRRKLKDSNRSDSPRYVCSLCK